MARDPRFWKMRKAYNIVPCNKYFMHVPIKDLMTTSTRSNLIFTYFHVVDIQLHNHKQVKVYTTIEIFWVAPGPEEKLPDTEDQEFSDNDAFFCMDICKQATTMANTFIIIMVCFESSNMLILYSCVGQLLLIFCLLLGVCGHLQDWGYVMLTAQLI
ncbi:unnamed protein product [Lactuca saligna]|uniref:Uncharacterized protein n=1 Tax=Lactuca saligna TaxID=75948 RepID=A0AA35ZWT3_LACSI|nr:unnamed protein product [Lactuca saligna]